MTPIDMLATALVDTSQIGARRGWARRGGGGGAGGSEGFAVVV